MLNWVCINLLSCLVVHLEGPELESGRQLTDGRQSEEKLLRWAQRHIRVSQLGLLDLLLLLLSGDHGQDFLRDKAGLERMHALIHTPDTCFLLIALTSMPSLFSAYSSKLTMAVLMVRGGGSTVRPMLMALLLLESKTMISWRFPSAAVFYDTKIHSRVGPPFCLRLFGVCGSVRLWGTNTPATLTANVRARLFTGPLACLQPSSNCHETHVLSNTKGHYKLFLKIGTCNGV